MLPLYSKNDTQNFQAVKDHPLSLRGVCYLNCVLSNLLEGITHLGVSIRVNTYFSLILPCRFGKLSRASGRVF